MRTPTCIPVRTATALFMMTVCAATARGQQPALGPLLRDPRWRRLEDRPGLPVWTDRFSNILDVVRW